MAILNLNGVSFHPVVVIGLDYDFLFKSILGHCVKGQALVMVFTISPFSTFVNWKSSDFQALPIYLLFL